MKQIDLPEKNHADGGTRIFRDRYYTDARDPRQSYDLAIPGNASGSAGLILCIHGGGWVEGDKEAYAGHILQVCEEKGVAAACMNYRYVSEAVGFGDVLDDVTAALNHIKATGREYGVDFDRLLLTGISAGGHLSLLYAYARKDEAPIRPVGVVALCGPTDLTHPFYYSGDNAVARAAGVEYFRRIIANGVRDPLPLDDLASAGPELAKYSPVHYVKEDTVPTVFGHGEQDEIVPYRNALDLDERLTEKNVPHTFVSFPRSGHGCEDPASTARMMELFFAYVNQYLK